jgi:Arc/MetJ family transcription regulator
LLLIRSALSPKSPCDTQKSWYNVYKMFAKEVQNVVLDEKLVQDCIKATGIKTQKALINHALRELLRHENQIRILELKGRISWDGNLDEWRQDRSL